MTAKETKRPRGKSLVRSVRGMDTDAIGSAEAALDQFGTLLGAARHLGIHRSSLRRAINESTKLREAWVRGSKSRRDARLKTKAEKFNELTERLQKAEARLKTATDELLANQVNMYANHVSEAEARIKVFREEYLALKRELKAKYHADGTPK